jgi:uncharacterized protein
MVDWVWDEAKSRSNLAKHGFGFDFAQLVFDDSLSSSRLDSFDLEERWQTIGQVGVAVIIVVHTIPGGGRPGRIISARNATRRERKQYEEGEFQ